MCGVSKLNEILQGKSNLAIEKLVEDAETAFQHYIYSMAIIRLCEELWIDPAAALLKQPEEPPRRIIDSILADERKRFLANRRKQGM